VLVSCPKHKRYTKGCNECLEGVYGSRELGAFGFAKGELAEQIRRLRRREQAGGRSSSEGEVRE
jgi:hypothetical protein